MSGEWWVVSSDAARGSGLGDTTNNEPYSLTTRGTDCRLLTALYLIMVYLRFTIGYLLPTLPTAYSLLVNIRHLSLISRRYEYCSVLSSRCILLALLLPLTENMIATLRKSQDCTLRWWGPQHRILGRKLGLGNMWLSSCGILRSGFLAKIKSAIWVYVGTAVPTWDCSARPLFMTLRTLFRQEILTSEFRKMIATCLLDPIFALESDVEVPSTSKWSLEICRALI